MNNAILANQDAKTTISICSMAMHTLWLTNLLFVQLTLAAPVINWRSPAAGGVAGGTVLTLSGSGFATDAYTSSNIVWLEGDGVRVICDFISYTATPHRIECRTRPYPNATEGVSYAPMKIAIITDSEYFISSLTFTYSWSETLPVELILPSSGPVGSLIEIAGYRLPNAAHTYDRLYLGDLQCNHFDNETNQPYGIRWYSSKRHIKCAVENQMTGGYNASIQFRDWANPRGQSWNGSKAMYLMYDGSLAMYELYPDIQSVSPHAGSTQGGTLLTVTGTGFGSNARDVEVDVNSIPCQVMSHNNTHIRCWTGRPHDGDLSIADEDGDYHVTDGGYRFRGSRGVSVKSYHGSIANLESLRSRDIYPDHPSRYSTYQSYSSEDTYKRNNYGERLEAFFNPQVTGNYSFFVAADDQAEVLLGSETTNISDLSSVSHVYRGVGWQNYYAYPSDQRSDMRRLEKGRDYLLVTEFAEGGGTDYVNVAVLMHETEYTHSQTQQSNREKQLVSLSTTGHYEIQSLTVILNVTALNEDDQVEEEDGIELGWGGERSVIVTATELLTNPNDTIATALLALFWGQCSYYTEHGIFNIEFWNDAVYGFEDNETHSSDIEMWLAWNGDTPVVVRNESLCGRSSLYLRDGRSLVFNLEANSKQAIELEDYPYYMCFAYKLPRGHAFSLLFHLRGVEQWVSAYFIRDVNHGGISMGSIHNLDASADIRDDDKWHYTCIDLQAMIANGFATPEDYEYNGVHFLEGFGFYADVDPLSRGFYLDEVSFSHSPRNLDTTAYVPPSYPNGIIIENITATNDSVAMDDGLVAMTITLEFNPLECGHNFTLFTARPTSTSQSVIHEVAMETVQEASLPLGGFFSLVVNGNGYSSETTPLSYDASADKIRAALEAIAGIGTITVTDGAYLTIDRYETGCPGRLFYVQFDDRAGDQPMIVVKSEGLSGDDVMVTVSEVVPGGMMSSPIPGHMLQTVETTPQVHVRVKGQLAACSGGHALYHSFDPDLEEDLDFCGFSYSPPITPHILTVAPPTVMYGDTVTITGTGFGDDPSLVLVLIGDVVCVVTSTSSEEVTCELGEGVAGNKQVFLQVVGGNGGIATVDVAVSPLEYTVTIATVSPGEGSQAGGTEITITGMGFASTLSDSSSIELDPGNEILSDAYQRALGALGEECIGGWENVVTVGEWECDIISADHMTITCVTPVNQNADATNTYDVMVQVRCTDVDSTSLDVSVSDGFTYSNDLTPELSGVTPERGTVHGGNSITISGAGFSDNPSEISVMLGGSTCDIISSTLNTITCISPAHSGGLVPVTVWVHGNGFAAGEVQYEYVFTITSLSHCSGSLLGGQLLDITGEGFGMDPTQLEVLLGDHLCNVNEMSDTLIRCVTSPTTTTHIIDNNATSVEYGLGYVWNPDEITITVGDSVLWNWYGTSFTRQLSVQEIASPGDVEYREGGFISQSGVRGSFSRVFTEAGDYYYIAGGYGHIGFNGTIHVVPLSDIEAPLVININAVPIEIPSSVVCGGPPEAFSHYTFAVDQTPQVLDTFPEVFSYQNLHDVTVTGLAMSPEHNLFTIGGKACFLSGHFSTNLVRPDFSGPSNNGIAYHGMEEMGVGCELGRVKPGVYRPVLHVAGKGHGLVMASAIVEVLPSYSRTHSDDPFGSLSGGTLLEIGLRGLWKDDITKTRVDIGNTPCSIHNIVPEDEKLFCLTQPARDDGYSSLVYALNPLAYWTLQTDYYGLDGSYTGSDGAMGYRNTGELGASGDASVRGEVVGREEGISGNAVTNQAALFNNSYLEVPFRAKLALPVGFGMGLWLKLPDVRSGSGEPLEGSMAPLGSGEPLSGSGDGDTNGNVGPYQIVVDFASSMDGVAYGYVIVINPCGQLEFWLANGQSFTDNENCPLISSNDCSPSLPPACSGLSLVTTEISHGNLPPGVWSVIRCGDCDTIMEEWALVSVGWAADWAGDCDGSTPCSGQQVFHFNQNFVDTLVTTYSTPTIRPLTIGGTDRLPLSGAGDMGGVESSNSLTDFVGYIDEISMFERPLTSTEVGELFKYGSTEKQKIWIRVESIDGISSQNHDIETVLEWNGAFEEVESLDWNGASDEKDIELDEGKALLFSWTGLKGILQVTKTMYESCDVTNEPIKEWSPPLIGGDVIVWLEHGETYYFIDPVPENCLSGSKVKVKVGAVQVVTWKLDQTYNDIILSEGTGLLFKWNNPNTPHNLIEMSSPQATSPECAFVGSNAEDLGKVVKAWQASPIASGEVSVSGLLPGNHYFVCSIGNHCQRGMRVNVTVTTEGDQQQDSSSAQATVDHVVSWRIQDYSPLTILHRDTVTFTWEGFHSLHQVNKETYETCDVSKEPLHVWAIPSVDTTVPLTDLQPGTYYFICSIAGHCDAGMKISVIVLPRDSPLTLLNPAVALCHGPNGCSFVYSTSHTPSLTDIQPSTGTVGTEVVVSGHGLVPHGYYDGLMVPTVTVWIGHAPCSDVTVVTTDPIETLRCTVTDYEAGYHFVDFTNDRGLAAVSGGAKMIPGPHRNISEPQGPNSPYPHFFLRPIVTSVSPATGSTAGGTMVTIVGSGFSLVAERMTVLLGESDCAIFSSTYSEIVCVTSEGGEGVRAVMVTVNGFEADTDASYEHSSSATPTISSVTPATGAIGESNIVISGTNFGTADPTSVSVSIPNGMEEWQYGSMESSCIISVVTETAITCTLPVKPAGEYLVVVHVSGRGLAEGGLTLQYALNIDTISPSGCGNGGGVLVTITGTGFPSSSDDVIGNDITDENIDSLSVWFCSTKCHVSTSSLTEITCVIAPPTDEDTSSVCSDIRVSHSGMTAITTDTRFEFSDDLTPHVTSISPLIGGTAGGTIVTIRGSKLLPPEVTIPNQDDVIITIDGAVCVWFGRSVVPNETTIECRTSDHKTTLLAEVKVFVRERGFAIPEISDTQIWYQYIDRWSSPYTWGGEDLMPKEGDSVLIQRGQVVFLDTDTPVLNLILVEGELVFEDLRDLHLQAKYIFINTGKLQVGTEESPFQHTARITLHGTVRDPEIPIYGAKVLAVRQGDLDLHGRPRLRTWTRLVATARVNDTTVVLQEPVDWGAGDRIVVAATGKDGNETEENEVMSVSADGLTVSLQNQLRYEHLGVTEIFEGGHSIEMRGEVGLLSHNVIVEGSQLGAEDVGGLGEDQYGVQIMIHRSGPYSTPIHIEHTEVRYAGQAFRLGRYAIHFHLTGSMEGSYVRNCAIHHSNNRALTAHGVHDLLVEGNVAYDIKGHTFFVEDGIETNNRYIGNLGIVTRGSSSLLNTDQIPATFWITNPRNTFIGNAAVASRGFGYWYDLDRFPSGASYTSTVCPNREPFGQFRDNTAHTCNEFGLRIWEEYTPFEDGCRRGAPANATFYNFTTYNNGIHGVEFSVIGHVTVDHFKIADNVEMGFEIQEANGLWGEAVIKNSLIVAHTAYNHGNPQQGGIKTQNRGRFIVSNVTFVNFDLAGSSCLRACSQCKFREGGFQVWLEGLQFYNSPNKVAFQWEHEVLFRDLDGSLTGHPGGGWALPNSPLLPPSFCSQSVPEFSINIGGASCTSDVYFLRLAWNAAQPSETLVGVSVNVTNEFGVSEVPWRHYRRTHRDGYMCTLPAAYPHTLEWNLTPEHNVDITSYSAGVYNIRSTDHVTITHRFIQLPDHVDLSGNYQSTESGELPQYGVDSHLSWHINNNTNRTTNVTYLISGEDTGSSSLYTDLHYTYRYEPCPRDGCVIIESPYGDKELRRWSDNSSWTNGQPPRAGDDVTILPQWHMLVDVTPPPLGRVFVRGELQFEDGRDYNFTADLILVHGPGSGMTIGTAKSPFQNHVTLTLTGRRGDSILALTSGLVLGSKAIGVFGNVSMHGRHRDVTWTHLSSSAMAGDTTITVETNTGWLVGDQIVIAPSGWGVDEGEIRTIAAILGQEITIDVSLEYNHEVYEFLDPLDLHDPSDPHWWNDGGHVAPEVGLLSHNIVVQGGETEVEPLETNHYGCRLLVGRYRAGNTVYSGQLWLQSVEFRYCGQGGYFSPRDPRYTIAFRSSRDTSTGSYIRDCAIHHGYNTAIGVHGSNGVILSRNVVWRTTDSAFKIGGLDNEALDNLAIHTTTVQPNNPPDDHSVDFPACFNVDAGNIARGNAAAGSSRIGFRLAGEPCQEDGQPPSYDQATLWGNTAHSGLIGLVILGLPSDCTAITGFTATHQWNYGIFSSTASSLVASHLRLSIGKVGMNLNVFGPDPVQHFIGGKSIAVSDSIIIGSLPGQHCSTSVPSWTGPTAIGVAEPSFGVMMSSFNALRSKMDGTTAWHLMKGYPVIDGVLQLMDVTFARFTANSPATCHYGTFAIGNNPLSPDAIHPVVISRTTLLNCDTNSLVYFHDPNPDWINQEDCIDMDCDGPKHALIDDRDGTFVGSYPEKGSVAPFAEIRFDDYSDRLPQSWLAHTQSDTPSDVLGDRGEGVAKGQLSVDCEWVEEWNAYRCHSLDHRMLVIESMDADTETRRLSPLALDGGDTGHGPYTDLLNGPMDHGWCTYYTCLKRLSTFFTIVAMGTDYHIWMTGSNPSALRFHVLNSSPDEAIRLNIWYKNPQRKDVYKDGVFIEATNTVYLESSAIREDGGEEYIPALDTSYSGANFFDRDTQIMHLLVKGSTPVEIRTAPVVQVAVNLDVSLDDFFDPNDLISRLAFVLKIDPSTIRVVKIVAEDSFPGGRRKRRQIGSGAPSSMTTITLEFGDPPDVNISQPIAPSVAEEIQMAGEVNDSVDIEDDFISTNQTLSDNPLNEDPPQSLSEYITGLNASVMQYVQSVESYLDQANQTMAANVIAEAVVNAILTNQLEVDNATITGVMVIPAPPPAPPSPPVIPPLYENVTGKSGDNVTVELVTVLEEVLDVLEETEVVAMESTPGTIVGGEEGEGVDFVIPDNMMVTMEPKEETGHLVHVKLTIFDASGEPVKHLGLVNPWMCEATLIHNDRLPDNERAQLEGVTAVPFVAGVAEFTRLRVDRRADQLTLSFTTIPMRFQIMTSVQFSVVGLPETVERKQVSFLFGISVPVSVEWGSEGVITEVVRQMGVALDVDLSRIQNVTMQEIEWNGERVVYVEFTLLGSHMSDPPNVPSLQEAGEKLQTLVDTGELIIVVDGVPLTAVTESFDITPSPPPTPTMGTEGDGVSGRDLVLILVVGGASTAIVLSIAIICVACCIRCHHGNKGKGNKKGTMSGRSSLSQLPRLRPTFKVNPIADDEGDSSDDNIEVTPSFRPPSQHLPSPFLTNLPSNPDLWDYDQDDDTDNSSLNRSVDNSDCWTAPMYTKPTYDTRADSRLSSNQPTTLTILANPPSTYHQSQNVPPSSLHHQTSHITYYEQPEEPPKGRSYLM